MPPKDSYNEQGALGEYQPREPPALCPQRRAHGHLLTAGIGAHQQQVGDVGTGDEQQQPDRPEQEQQGRALVADEIFL